MYVPFIVRMLMFVMHFFPVEMRMLMSFVPHGLPHSPNKINQAKGYQGPCRNVSLK